MAPTLMCLLALVSADAEGDRDQTVAEQSAQSKSQSINSSQTGFTPPKDVTAAYRSSNTAAEDTSPFVPVDMVFRGQTPTYVDPNAPQYQGEPVLLPPPGGAGIQQLPPAGVGVQPFLAPPVTTQFFAMYENVLVRPYFSQNTSIHVLGPGGAGFGAARQFNWDFEYSPRVEFGVVGPDGAGWRARYWHFEHSTNDFQVAAPGEAITIAPDAISGFGVGNVPPATSLQAQHSMRVSVLDAEYLKKGLGGDGGFELSYGLRYARMTQWLRGRAFTPASVMTANNALRHEFEGIGPTIAAGYRRPLYNTNWGFVGNARFALMYGETNYRFDQRLQPADVLVASTRNNNDRGLLSSLEFQVGFDYRAPISQVHEFVFKVALEAQYWASAGSASADLNGMGSASALDSDMGFFGLTIGTGLNW